MTDSADGKGRTLWDILTGKNKKDTTPVEMKYHNPLGLKLGQIIEFDAVPEIQGIGFTVEKIVVYTTHAGGNKFFHVDYRVKGISTSKPKPIHLILRVLDDEDAVNEIGCKLQLLHTYNEMLYDQGVKDLCNANGDHDDTDDPNEVTFKINYDEDKKQMDTPWKFWRIGGQDLTAYKATTTTLERDKSKAQTDDPNDSIDVTSGHVTYWDFSRITEDAGDQDVTEFFTVEMNTDAKGYLTMLRGPEAQAFQVRVI